MVDVVTWLRGMDPATQVVYLAPVAAWITQGAKWLLAKCGVTLGDNPLHKVRKFVLVALVSALLALLATGPGTSFLAEWFRVASGAVLLHEGLWKLVDAAKESGLGE